MQTNRRRSVLFRSGRFGIRRRSTLICCRRTRISASSFALDLKSEATTPRISLNRSFIRSRTYAVCSLRPCRIEYSVHTGDKRSHVRPMKLAAQDICGSKAASQIKEHRVAKKAKKTVVRREYTK